jgi:tellurite resistance protein
MTAANPNAEGHDASTPRIAHYPITFFAIGMGMMGLTLAIKAAERAFELPNLVSPGVLAVSVVMLTAVALGYGIKALAHPAEVRAEWHHPVRIAFFPAISISLLLLAAALLEPMPQVAHVIWLVGTALQGVLALSVIGAWIGHRSFQQGQLTPAWFIPAVGNVIVPLAGARLGYMEISWLFFSGGLIFWVVLLSLVMNRLMFHDPLPGKMVPTLMILVAPPAVAFTAWLRLSGDVGPFGHFLLSAAYVFALLVATQVAKFRNMPFALSWWALSFPLAALTIASFGYAEAAGSAAHRLIGAGLLALLVAVVSGLILSTWLAIRAGQICLPE